jgi:uncharacterized membrane protein
MLRAHPRLVAAVLTGVLVSVLLPHALVQHPASRVLIGWNAGVALYIGLVLRMALTFDPRRIQARAIREDDGRGVVLTLVVLATLAVLLAIGSQLLVVRDMQGQDGHAQLVRMLHVLLAATTLVSGWLFTQASFALHYAHDFYLARSRGQSDVLDFPGTREPDYVDFLYFSCIIGTSGQTADVAVTSSAGRRINLLHCVLAFFFNTTVLALTINIAASLLGP